MSYVLAFWRGKNPLGASPLQIYRDLSEAPMEWLLQLPTEDIFQELAIIFPGLEQASDGWFWGSEEIDWTNAAGNSHSWTANSGAFQCYVQPGFLIFSFYFGDRKVMEEVEKALASFDCHCFDPQITKLKTRSRALAGVNLQLISDVSAPISNPSPEAIADFVLGFGRAPAANPGFVILEGRGDDYVQATGADGKVTVEWRIYNIATSFKHSIAGRAGDAKISDLIFDAPNGQLQIKSNECLTVEEACDLFMAYRAGGAKPDGFAWRDITDRF